MASQKREFLGVLSRAMDERRFFWQMPESATPS